MPPFQQKSDADADRDDWPDPKGIEADQTDGREKECHSNDHKERASDNAVKGMILDPIGEAADSHREKACNPPRPKRVPIDSNKA